MLQRKQVTEVQPGDILFEDSGERIGMALDVLPVFDNEFWIWTDMGSLLEYHPNDEVTTLPWQSS